MIALPVVPPELLILEGTWITLHPRYDISHASSAISATNGCRVKYDMGVSRSRVRVYTFEPSKKTFIQLYHSLIIQVYKSTYTESNPIGKIS